MNPQLILLIILTIVRFWIGLQLFLTARKSKQSNLYWLAAVFVFAIYSIFTPIANSPLGSYWVFHLGFIAGHFCLAMFIHSTFYRGKNSPIAFMLGLMVVAFFIDIYALSINDLNLVGIVASVGIINWFWHLIVASSAYRLIAADSSVEKWVKARYRLMGVYIVMILLTTAQVVVSTTNLSPYIPGWVLSVNIVIILGSIILQFLVWVMPESFRRWLNREKTARPVHEEQHALSVMDVFGTAMTNDTGLKSIACLYAIRAAVAKRIGSENSDAIQTYMNTMSYQEWELILQHSELRRILINGGADEGAVSKAITNARQALVDKQSLLTLATR